MIILSFAPKSIVYRLSPIVHRLLSTVYRPSFIVYFLPSIVHRLLSTVYRLSSAVYRPSSIVYLPSSIVYCLSSIFHRLSLIVYRLSCGFSICPSLWADHDNRSEGDQLPKMSTTMLATYIRLQKFQSACALQLCLAVLLKFLFLLSSMYYADLAYLKQFENMDTASALGH